MNVLAFLNQGRWIVECPKCGKDGATLAENRPEISPYWTENNAYICPNCHPGMIVISGKYRNGRYQFNQSARDAARAKAAERNEIYIVEFPADRKKIMELVKDRPLTNQNWIPGETLEFLARENAERGY